MSEAEFADCQDWGRYAAVIGLAVKMAAAGWRSKLGLEGLALVPRSFSEPFIGSLVAISQCMEMQTPLGYHQAER